MGTRAATSERRTETRRQRLARRAKARSDWLGRFMYALWSFHRTFRLPLPSAFGRALRAERSARTAGWGFVKRVLYYDPLFRACCERVGKGLHLVGAAPLVVGDGRIIVGENVTINAPTTFAFARVSGTDALLTVGDRSFVGSDVAIFIAAGVSIGADCIIGPGTTIFDNPAHPVDPAARLAGEPMAASEIAPIAVEDNCWISSHVRILPGVRIGEGSVVGTSSVVTRDIPPYSLAVGNPAQVVRSLGRAQPTEENGRGRPHEARGGRR